MVKMVKLISISIYFIFAIVFSYVLTKNTLSPPLLGFIGILIPICLVSFFDLLTEKLLNQDYYQSFFINRLATIDELKIYNYDIYVNNLDRCVVGKICQKTTENGDNLLKVFLTKANEKVDKRKEIISEYYFIGEFYNLNDVYFSLNKIANKSIGGLSYENKQSPYQLIKTINGWEIEKDNVSLFVFSNYNNAIKKINKIKQKTIKCIRLDLLQNYLKINFK